MLLIATAVVVLVLAPTPTASSGLHVTWSATERIRRPPSSIRSDHVGLAICNLYAIQGVTVKSNARWS